jgi:predicted nucleotide-binding protein
MCQKGEQLPFDLASLRVIFFDIADLESVDMARRHLATELASLDEGSGTFSPVSAAADVAAIVRGDIQTGTVRGDVSDSILSALTDINQRLDALQANLRTETSEIDPEAPTKYARKVFIIHGRDDGTKNELARLLERLDFEPIILHERPDRGQTIFEKLRSQLSDVGYAFVLLTPDDVGGLASNPTNLVPRARQNVVFEHGLFVGHLLPDRVCAIRRGDVEIPSDLHGVVYKTLPESGGISSLAYEIVRELRAADYIVDANKV